MDLIDGAELVSNEDAIAMAHQLMKKEGILVGISSGAAVVAAKRIAEKPENADKILLLFYLVQLSVTYQAQCLMKSLVNKN